MFSAWNDQQTSHFYCKSQDFYPFSWQILVLPALVLSISVSVFPWNRQFQQHRLLCCHRPDDFAGPIVCDRNLWWKIHSLSLVCPHLPISATSWPLLYTLAFCPFSPSFTKWTNLRPFHFFFVVLKFHSYVCKDVGETSYTDFILKCSLQSIFHISFHPNSIQLFTLQVQPASLFLHYSCSHQSSIFLHGPHFSVYQLPFALDGCSPLFFC